MSFYFYEVRDIEGDESKSGRVKLRAYPHKTLDHSDEQNVKDEDLPWGMPLMPATSPSTNKAGMIPTGLQVGSRVLVCFADGDVDKQYPIILGSFHRAFPPVSNENEDDSEKDGNSDVDKEQTGVDIPAPGNPEYNEKGQLSPNNAKVSPESYEVESA